MFHWQKCCLCEESFFVSDEEIISIQKCDAIGELMEKHIREIHLDNNSEISYFLCGHCKAKEKLITFPDPSKRSEAILEHMTKHHPELIR